MKPQGAPSMGPLDIESKADAETVNPSSERRTPTGSNKTGSQSIAAAALSLVFSLILALNFFERYREASLMGDEYVCIAEPVCNPESDTKVNYGNTWKDSFAFAVFCFAFMMIVSVLIIF